MIVTVNKISSASVVLSVLICAVLYLFNIRHHFSVDDILRIAPLVYVNLFLFLSLLSLLAAPLFPGRIQVDIRIGNPTTDGKKMGREKSIFIVLTFLVVFSTVLYNA